MRIQSQTILSSGVTSASRVTFELPADLVPDLALAVTDRLDGRDPPVLATCCAGKLVQICDQKRTRSRSGIR